MDWGTTYRKVLREVGKPVSSTDLQERAKSCVADAIDELRKMRSFQNFEGRFSLTLSDGKAEYAPGEGQGSGTSGVPFSLCAIHKDLQLSTSSTAEGFTWIQIVTKEEFESEFHRDEYDGTVREGHPRVASWFGGKLRFAPTPNSDGSIVSGYGEWDTGAPIVRWDSTTSAFKFYLPNDSAEIDDTYTSAWFSDLRQVVVSKAKELFIQKYIRDDGEQAKARLEFSEQLSAHKSLRTRMQAPRRRRLRWI